MPTYSSTMEKTVVVVAANNFMSASCGQNITFDLTPSGKGGSGKGAGGPGPTKQHISKSLWTCCVEAVCDYCRIVFDLFPNQYQVCVAGVDEAKCQPINSWRDEDQEMGKVLAGFQKFVPPHFQPPPPPPPPRAQPHSPYLSPCLQGMQYAVRCLAQLTATQYATTTFPGSKPITNQGRIVFLCALKNAADVKELEKAIVNLVRAENSDIKQKQDQARLHIHHCQLVLVNTYSQTANNPTEVKDSPLTQLSSQVSSVVYSFPGPLLLDKCVHLAKMHFNLKSTIITGIPMKEEQTGGSSTNYDVELIHLAEAHRDILRAGYGLGAPIAAKKDPKDKESSHKDAVMLKWSTPKSTSLELQFCTSAYRVTPTNVTSRPTICLINFVLSGKPVLLEQARKGVNKVITHVLTSYKGVVFIHCIPTSRAYLDDPPSISEGWGGRITDYRIADFNQLVHQNILTPHPVERTKIPTVFPVEQAVAKLEYDTRHWPMVYNDTLVFTLKQELDPLPDLIRRETLTESELEECKRVIVNLQSREAANEPLSVPSSGGRSKGVKRDEQYRSLWNELETLTQVYCKNSERHQTLLSFLQDVMSHCSSVQVARKTPTASNKDGQQVSSASNSKVDLAWQELDRYKQMTEREKRELDHERQPLNLTTNQAPPPSSRPLPIPAKPVATLLSMWTAREHHKASTNHVEFAGRRKFGERAELYLFMKNSGSVVVPVDQET